MNEEERDETRSVKERKGTEGTARPGVAFLIAPLATACAQAGHQLFHNLVISL